MNYPSKILLAACACLPLAFAHAGALPDPSFGDGGIVTLDVMVATPMTASVIEDGLVDQYGRVVTVGLAADGRYDNAERRNYGLVARRLPDGSPDTSFDGDGHRVIDWHDEDVRWLAVKEQPDGRLLVAGKTHKSVLPLMSTGLLCRLEVDGAFDPSFGTQGCRELLQVRDAPGAVDLIDIELLPDGRILVLGHAASSLGAPGGTALFRLTPMGMVDLGFGDSTVCETPAPRCGVAYSPAALGAYVKPSALAIDTLSQRLLVASRVNAESLHALPVLAFDADGASSTVLYAFTFNTLGYGQHHMATDIHVSPEDGSTFVSAFVSDGSSTRLAVAKLGPGGTPDAAFGNDGRALGDAAHSSDATASSLSPDGTLIVAFREPASENAAESRCRLARFDGNSGENGSMGNGDGLFHALDALGDCSPQSTFHGGGSLYTAGAVEMTDTRGETAYIMRLDTTTLMRDGFEESVQSSQRGSRHVPQVAEH